MKTIQVYDPPMCCSTGLCGTEIDPALVSFAAMLTELGQKGVKVERYNMGQQPMAFVQNPTVKALLDKESTEALPLILLDGAVYLKGRYLTDEVVSTVLESPTGLQIGGEKRKITMIMTVLNSLPVQHHTVLTRYSPPENCLGSYVRAAVASC
jgi:hypothetical protein